MVAVCFDGVQLFIELRIKTPAKAIHFLGIGINIVVTILTQVVELLGVLIYRVRTLPHVQELI
jgi:hypothetical protein